MRAAAVETYERSVSAVQRHKDNLTAAVDAGRQTYRDATSKPAGE